MNKLTFRTVMERNIDQGSGKASYLAFYYIVDGTTLTFPNYNPADYTDILDGEYDYLNVNDSEEDVLMVVLNHCTCGSNYCDCIVADCYEEEQTVKWIIHKQNSDIILGEYEFDRNEYQLTINEIKQLARQEQSKFHKNGEPMKGTLIWSRETTK